MKKQIVMMAGLMLTLLTVPSFAGETAPEGTPVRTWVTDIDKYGNMTLEVSATEVQNNGIEFGDLVTVTLNDTEYEMPVGAEYSDVDQGEMLCRLKIRPEKNTDEVEMGINMGNLAGKAGLATREDTDGDPGFRWNLNKGVPDPIPVSLVLKEKGAYKEQLSIHRLEWSDKREDYQDLDDAAYANFREVTTTGMGSHALYRSSSPVSPKYNRNKEADAACRAAGIKTVLNLTDNEKEMRAYEGFDNSYYSGQDIICLELPMDFQSDEFRDGLARELTFLTEHKGPFLVHCIKGQDRTGFVCAVLEAFMGADLDEIVRDYMITFENYHGVKQDDEMYTKIAESNIMKTLSAAFGVDSLDGVDLKKAAAEYLGGIGLSKDTVSLLREKLGADY